MSPYLDLFLYVGVGVTLAYLIYRYGRYSKWEATDAGRAFMLMKVCLLALVLHVISNIVFHNDLLRDITRVLVVGGTALAVAYQVRVVVRSQGGFHLDQPLNSEQ